MSNPNFGTCPTTLLLSDQPSLVASVSVVLGVPAPGALDLHPHYDWDPAVHGSTCRRYAVSPWHERILEGIKECGPIGRGRTVLPH
jgi:hypothetical protein